MAVHQRLGSLATFGIWQHLAIIPNHSWFKTNLSLPHNSWRGGKGGRLELGGRSHQLGTPRCVVKQWRSKWCPRPQIWIDPPCLQICSFLVDAKLIELGWSSCHATSHRVILYKSYHLTLREGVAPLPDEFLDPIHAGPPSQWWKSALAQYPQGLNAEETGFSCELTLQPAWNSTYVVYFCLTQHCVARTPKSQWIKIVIWLKLVETHISWTCPLIALIAWLAVHVFQSSSDMWQFEAGSHAEASGCWHGGG